MSIIDSPRKSRPLAARIVLVQALALGLIGGTVALAGPATAATSERGCTVDPLKPTQHHHEVDFRIHVDCDGKKTVEIRQLRFEDDHHGRDDRLGKSTFEESFGPRDDSVTLHNFWDVPKNSDHKEVYQLVSFRVRSGNSDNWSDWTRWEKSDAAIIHDCHCSGAGDSATKAN
ncbi:hypothetical protein [Arthrobacter sp. UYEF36]|uniref:hypothetical protein n=1 Tax=Arthrobacter sp. UYEF36 TaxID=1756366 RepID=UPI003396239D